MSKIMKGALAAFLLILLSLSASFAQTTTPAAAKPEPDYVTEKGFKSKVLEVKHRDASSLANVLRQLGSGFKGSAISANTEFKTITVRDFPENLVTMEEALKRLDTPASARVDIEMHMHVLLASTSGTTTGEFPAELKDVLTQLRSTLNYRSFELVTSVVQRLTETPRGLRGKGTAEISRSPASGGTQTVPYDYLINNVNVISTSAGASTIQIGEFVFSTGLTSSTLDNRTQVQTALNLRDGEKVVVGTATLGDRAFIIVLTAKLVN